MSEFQDAYRIYSFDGITNAVSSDWLDALSDEDAIAEAQARGFGTKGEVWSGTRLVATLGGDSPAA